jgi:hypothetical protein
MTTILFLMALFCFCSAQYGDSSGGIGMTYGFSNGNGVGQDGSSSSSFSDSDFFHDGRDLRSLWSFGVNGFFIPPPDFAGLPMLASNGTIIPTAAVGLFCLDGAGSCALELTAVVGGNLGSQVFNVSMNKVRLISSMCRVRVSRLGRVHITAKLSEVSTRLVPMPVLSIPLVIVAQLASNNFAFIAFDQLFVMEGQAIRIRRFDNFFNNNQNNNHGDWSQPGIGGGNGPSMGGPGGPGNTWGNTMGGNFGNNNNNNRRNNNGGVCPSLLEDMSSDGMGGGGNGGRGNFGNGNGWSPYDDGF